MKRVSMVVALILLTSSALAYDHDDKSINTGSELRDWCKEESGATLIGNGLKPFNWTASYWDDADVLNVKGSWRVVGDEVTVEC